MNWPDNEDHFLIRSFNNRTTVASGGVSSVKLLGAKEPLDWKLTSDGLWIRKPAAKPCSTAFAFQITTKGICVERLDATRVDDGHIQVEVRVRNLDKKAATHEITFYNNEKAIGKASFSLGKSESVTRSFTFETPRKTQNETISAGLAGGLPFSTQCPLFNPPAKIASWVCDGKSMLSGSGLGKLDKLTLSLWTKTDALRENWTALLNTPGWEKGGFHVQYLKSGRLQVSLKYSADGIVDVQSTASPGLAKGWSLVTVTYDSAARKAEVFVNGKLDSKITTNSAFPVDLDAFSLAGWSTGARRFIGRIADVRIYDRVLTSEQISSLVEGKAIADGLIAAWDFKGQAGDTVKDTSGHGHDLKKAQ